MRGSFWLWLLIALLPLMVVGCGGLSFSPDGKQIVCWWLYNGKESRLVIFNADGTHPRLIPNSEEGWSPSWSPNGRYILFAKDSYRLHLYDLLHHTTTALEGELPIAWRPDGCQFVAVRRQEQGRELVWYHLPSLQEFWSLPLPERCTPYSLLWLPQTDGVAMLAGPEGDPDLYLIEAAELKRITTTNDVIGMGLSPDGKKLVWARWMARERLISLYALDLRNHSVQRLPFPERLLQGWIPRDRSVAGVTVSFSPKGTHLLILVQHNQRSNPLSLTLYCARIDGTQLQRVRNWNAKETQLAGLKWSPDGKRFAWLELKRKKDHSLTVSLWTCSPGAQPKQVRVARHASPST